MDQVWHALLLFPRAYQRLCAGLLGDGELIDHDPRAATSDPAIRDEERFATLRELGGESTLSLDLALSLSLSHMTIL